MKLYQKYPDHFHPQTLKKLAPKQVIAPKSLANKLKKVLPAATIIRLDSTNSQTEINKVKVTFLATKRKMDPIYDTFLLDDGKESVFLATHGFQMSEKDMDTLKTAAPCQLLLTPFTHYKLPAFLGGVVSPGLEGVQHLCQVIKPKNVVATHDEDKHAKGLVSKLAKIVRPASKESLSKLQWLSGRYQEINNYDLVQIV